MALEMSHHRAITLEKSWSEPYLRATRLRISGAFSHGRRMHLLIFGSASDAVDEFAEGSRAEESSSSD